MLAAARLAVAALAAVALGSGCRSLSDHVTFAGPRVFAGQEVSAEVLDAGREHYVQNCYACHGMAGDGKGPASHYYRPPPRDLRTGLYKFGGVMDGLPHDADFVRILRHGLAGTPMLAWDIPDAELYPIIQYIKSLSRVWQEAEQLGQQIPVDTDNWRGRETDAVARGKQVYHGLATCQQCHPAYATEQEMYEAARQFNRTLTEFRPQPFQPEAKESQYEADGRKLRILPPDFLFNEVRSGRGVADLYRVISAGIPGTAMPTWYGALPVPDVWAMAYYVQSLIERRGTPEGAALRRALASAPPLVAPSSTAAAAAAHAVRAAPAHGGP